MSISRRLFIKAASVTAVVAATIGKSSLAAFAEEDDPLVNYNQQTFTQQINSVFLVHGPQNVEVTLVSLEDTLPAGEQAPGRECFVLHFRGGSQELPQNTYTIDHPSLGTFKLFLVPGGADGNGVQRYGATINRVPLT